MNYKYESTRLELLLLKLLRKYYNKDISIVDDPEKIIQKVCIDLKYKNNYKKNYIYFSEVLYYVRKKIHEGCHQNLFFSALEQVAYEAKDKIKNGELTVDDAAENVSEIEDFIFEDAIKKRIDFLINNEYDRKSLEWLEQKQVDDSKDNYTDFTDERARGKIIGALNRGFYLRTLEELKKYIKENGGKGNGKDRFISNMPDELLMYKLAIMDIAERYAKVIIDNNYSVDDLKEKMYNLGQTARNMFTKEYLSVPEEVLLKYPKIKEEKEDGIQIEFDINPKKLIRK